MKEVLQDQSIQSSVESFRESLGSERRKLGGIVAEGVLRGRGRHFDFDEAWGKQRKEIED